MKELTDKEMIVIGLCLQGKSLYEATKAAGIPGSINKLSSIVEEARAELFQAVLSKIAINMDKMIDVLVKTALNPVYDDFKRSNLILAILNDTFEIKNKLSVSDRIEVLLKEKVDG